MELFKLPIFWIFIIYLILAHLVGFRSRGRFSKSLWKSGDYIWLSLAFFTLINVFSNLRIHDANTLSPILKSEIIESYNQRIDNLEDAEKLLISGIEGLFSDSKFDVDLSDVANQAKSIDKKTMELRSHIDENEIDKMKTELESSVFSIYPYFLVFALIIRITMASAEVFNWYKK